MTVSSLFSRELLRRSKIRTNEPLHVIHELSDEDEPRFSIASAEEASRAPSPGFLITNATVSNLNDKSRRRHVSIIPATFKDDVFTEASSPVSSISSPSSLKIPHCAFYEGESFTPEPSPDSFSLVFGNKAESFRFPHPPLPTPSSSSFSFATSISRYHSSSSSPSSSPDAISTGLPVTPTTSDDEFMTTQPLRIVKHNVKSASEYPEISDLEFYASEFSEILTLNSPLPPNFPGVARTDSVSIRNNSLERGSAHKITLVPLPSVQLDPAYPKRTRSSMVSPIPSRPPPPPPACRARPPPRFSVPTDFEFDDDDLNGYVITEFQADGSELSHGGVYSLGQLERLHDPELTCNEAEDDMDFEFEDLDQPLRLPLSLPVTPIDLEGDIACGLAQLHVQRREQLAVALPSETEHDDQERVLKSRWSSSTLSSVHEEHGNILSARLKTYFSHSKRPRKSGSSAGGLVSPTAWNKRFSPPSSPASRKSENSLAAYYASQQSPHGTRYLATVKRRGSRSSSSASSVAGSEGSCESSGSSGSGLRRKPIPVEMFLRA